MHKLQHREESMEYKGRRSVTHEKLWHLCEQTPRREDIKGAEVLFNNEAWTDETQKPKDSKRSMNLKQNKYKKNYI